MEKKNSKGVNNNNNNNDSENLKASSSPTDENKHTLKKGNNSLWSLYSNKYEI